MEESLPATLHDPELPVDNAFGIIQLVIDFITCVLVYNKETGHSVSAYIYSTLLLFVVCALPY